MASYCNSVYYWYQKWTISKYYWLLQPLLLFGCCFPWKNDPSEYNACGSGRQKCYFFPTPSSNTKLFIYNYLLRINQMEWLFNWLTVSELGVFIYLLCMYTILVLEVKVIFVFVKQLNGLVLLLGFAWFRYPTGWRWLQEAGSIVSEK